MKKKLSNKKLLFSTCAMTLSMSMVLLSGCGNKTIVNTQDLEQIETFAETASIAAQNSAQVAEQTKEKANQGGDSSSIGELNTLKETEYGTKEIDATYLQSMVENGETFLLYVKGDKNLPFEYDAMENTIKEILHDYEFPFEVFTLDENAYLNEDETIVASILGEKKNVTDILNAKVEDETNKVTEDLGTTYYGFYVFDKGNLIGQENNIAVAEGEMMRPIIMLIYNAEFFLDNHGFEVLTYEDVKKKIDDGESFLLYVGRDSCTYCHVFQQVLRDTFDEHSTTTPVYYFYSHSYKKAIDAKEENAQQIWDDIREDLGFKRNATLINFVDGENKGFFQCDEYMNSTEYLQADDNGRKEQRDIIQTELLKFLEENNNLKDN